MSWDPERYERFTRERLEPGLDLIARLPPFAPRTIVDLGCGTGALTVALARTYPSAALEGLDASEAMLEVARERCARITWRREEIASWVPAVAPDLIFSNAALHWLEDHERVFPRLAGLLAAGGVLAVQMPRNDDSPARRAVAAAVEDGPWRARLKTLWRPNPVASPEFYENCLAPYCRTLELWQSTYEHRLTGENPVADWFEGTTLAPLLGGLDEQERDAFRAAVAERVAAAYPRDDEGVTHFPFRRLFILARRR